MLTATVVGADNGVEPCPLRTTDTVASNIEADIVALTAWILFWRTSIKLFSSGCDGRDSWLWGLKGRESYQDHLFWWIWGRCGGGCCPKALWGWVLQRRSWCLIVTYIDVLWASAIEACTRSGRVAKKAVAAHLQISRLPPEVLMCFLGWGE